MTRENYQTSPKIVHKEERSAPAGIINPTNTFRTNATIQSEARLIMAPS